MQTITFFRNRSNLPAEVLSQPHPGLVSINSDFESILRDFNCGKIKELYVPVSRATGWRTRLGHNEVNFEFRDGPYIYDEVAQMIGRVTAPCFEDHATSAPPPAAPADTASAPDKTLDLVPLVQQADIDTLRLKDASYGSSWKKRGGTGAFMMLARKWDRIETQCAAKGYDIFAAIRASAPLDDNLADDIADLRCYLLLVEAEICRLDKRFSAQLRGRLESAGEPTAAYVNQDGKSDEWGYDPLVTKDRGANYNVCHELPVSKSHPNKPTIEGALINQMVHRFLCWTLPEDFCPDGGITFDREGSLYNWPTGTNLLNALQARALMRHVLSDPSAE